MRTIDTEIDCVGPGWHALVRQLDADIREITPTYEVIQIKEKFGGLRYYIALINNVTDDQRRQVYALVQAAEALSFQTCEECGSQEQVSTLNRGGWIRTLCESCGQ